MTTDDKTCGDCRYFKPTGIDSIGFCKFNPPKIARYDENFFGEWPRISDCEWCGEWKEKSSDKKGFRERTIQEVNLNKINLGRMNEYLHREKEYGEYLGIRIKELSDDVCSGCKSTTDLVQESFVNYNSPNRKKVFIKMCKECLRLANE